MTLTHGNTQKIRNLVIICMISVLMGQFYISPFNTVFRMTLAVYFMSLFLLYFEDYSVMLITMSVGISTMLFRSVVNYVGSDLSFIEVLSVYSPVLIYYVFFGAMFKFLSVRNLYEQPFNFFLSLWICDSMGNILEASVRRTWETASFESLITTIILVGGARTVMTLTTFYAVRHFHHKVKKQAQDKYFNELIFFISKLKTELFFLNKSRADIEETVAYAHDYYQKLEDEADKAPFLKIAKDIHEIKKDYLRVIAGMNAVFKVDAQLKYMSVRDILYIVKDNVGALSTEQGKKVEILFDYDYLFVTPEFYTIISILNNLCVNSLDAIQSFGQIRISVHYSFDEKCVRFEVVDTGEGIAEERKALVFDVGYTTKYDKRTGHMSTGLGLSHVKQLIYEVFDGEVWLDSVKGKGTRVGFSIPMVHLIKEVEDSI